MSLTHSMNILTRDFLISYDWDLSKYTNKDDIMNDLYFYWFRNSAEKRYLWCEELSGDVFSEKFANEMKIMLYLIYCRLSLKNNMKSSKKTNLFKSFIK